MCTEGNDAFDSRVGDDGIAAQTAAFGAANMVGLINHLIVRYVV